MKIQTLINRVQSKSYYAHRSSVVLSFERFSLSVTTYPQIGKNVNLLDSRATVGVKVTTENRTEIIHIETGIIDIDMDHITTYEGEECIYSIKLKDAMIQIDDNLKTDNLLNQVVYVKLHLKSNTEEEEN